MTPLSQPTELLKVERLEVRYGQIRAVRELSITVGTGELVALVGANGAGKSSALLALSGLITPAAGSIHLAGQEISSWSSQRRVRAGLIQVPEGRAILKQMSVAENLRLGGYASAETDDLEESYRYFPILRTRAHQLAGNLSGGEQQMLAMARALRGRPRLLLLDEPSMGLAPLMVRELFGFIDELHQQGVSILLVEQNVRQALKLADRAYVLENGKVALTGSGAELAHTPAVVSAYLGG